MRSGYLEGIIGLPPNLFYGTGIPACIVVLDKENAQARRGVFMIDASRGFLKDGNKNRLRERDLHQIVDVFTNAEEHAGYSRLVPHDEVEKNEFNLNLPRYIDSRAAEDLQDLGGHLHGGIPTRDIDAFADYWQVCPDLRADLFQPNRPDYDDLRVEPAQLKSTIYGHPQFATFLLRLTAHFAAWTKQAAMGLRSIGVNALPKSLLHEAIPPLLEKWSAKLGVTVARYFLQRMKTWWGSCNHTVRHVRFNTELVKKPKDLLEYVVVHELSHLVEPTHNEQFVAIWQEHYPNWREARTELNELPLAAEIW